MDRMVAHTGYLVFARKVLAEGGQDRPGQDGADGDRPPEDWLTSGRVHGRRRAMERGDQDNYW
jgi:hypothetical protein